MELNTHVLNNENQHNKGNRVYESPNMHFKDYKLIINIITLFKK